MNKQALANEIVRKAADHKLTTRHGLIVVALRMRRRDGGGAYWPIRTTASIAEDLGEMTKDVIPVMNLLERRGIVRSDEKEPRTGHLLYRLTRVGQQILIEAAVPQPETEAAT